MTPSPPSFDLLITGGHVLDPVSGIDGRTDIGITGGRIAAVAPNLDPTRAARVLEIRGDDRYVVPGLIDIHTHVAHGATTAGVGMGCCDPDEIGVRSGVTTVVDCGSVGVANLGVFPVHVLPRARTRVEVYVNAGSHAHTMPGWADIARLDDIDERAIAACVEHNPGLVAGVKLRLVGDIVNEVGEEVVDRSKKVAREHGVPLMVHIGDLRAAQRPRPDRMGEVTRHLLRVLEPGDVLTHLCTPNVGGVMDDVDATLPLLTEARARGVTLDPALGLGNFGYAAAREQAERGLHPDTISSDLTAGGQGFHSLVECMAKFMAVGYSFADVVAMTTGHAAAAIGKQDEIGAIAVGREADLTVLDVVRGEFTFVDTTKASFTGEHGIVPVHTIRAGELVPPGWGPHPWGWLPATEPGAAR
ncbi:MAG TPA: amidohydrolase family protein [Pseudonocardia sp.]|jgi:dihydroorotase|uniref:amidohydrolase family protein n=1 Tax=Pseudonocardia sp. TaxID=60912 RepID=UPI002B4B7F9B|nr:amidohydrolase family protein [Pseudonocardia sp.]HLU58642.1 amidohydrolase family protein [Pseudonocardia sp.]